MRNPIAIVRALTLPRLTARLAAMASFAAFLSTAPFHAALAQTAPSLGTAQSFSVLGGTAVTCTTSVVTGDVGVSPGTELVQVTAVPPRTEKLCAVPSD